MSSALVVAAAALAATPQRLQRLCLAAAVAAARLALILGTTRHRLEAQSHTALLLRGLLVLLLVTVVKAVRPHLAETF